MSEREMLLKKIATYDFAIVELGLYLDTHPGDKAAEVKLLEYRRKSNKLREDFETNYGPISQSGNDNTQNQLAWISGPWPWDRGEV